MPPPSTVYTLPVATREELDRRLFATGFGGYEGHTAWLAELGHAISESALQRYGKRLKRSAERDAALASERTAAVVARVREAQELARAINEAAGDDPLAVPEKAAELLMARLYEVAANENIDAKTLQAVSRSLNDSLKTIAAIRGERAETKGRAGAQPERRGLSPATLAAIRAKVEQGNHIPLEVLKIIRREVYGIADDRDDHGPSGPQRTEERT